MERADAATARLVRGLNALFDALSVPGSAWAVSSMCTSNLGTDAPRPRAVEWDAAGEPPGVAPELVQPLKWALFNHGVDLMGTGAWSPRRTATKRTTPRWRPFGAAIGDLRDAGLLR